MLNSVVPGAGKKNVSGENQEVSENGGNTSLLGDRDVSWNNASSQLLAYSLPLYGASLNRTISLKNPLITAQELSEDGFPELKKYKEKMDQAQALYMSLADRLPEDEQDWGVQVSQADLVEDLINKLGNFSNEDILGIQAYKKRIEESILPSMDTLLRISSQEGKDFSSLNPQILEFIKILADVSSDDAKKIGEANWRVYFKKAKEALQDEANRSNEILKVLTDSPELKEHQTYLPEVETFRLWIHLVSFLSAQTQAFKEERSWDFLDDAERQNWSSLDEESKEIIVQFVKQISGNEDVDAAVVGEMLPYWIESIKKGLADDRGTHQSSAEQIKELYNKKLPNSKIPEDAKKLLPDLDTITQISGVLYSDEKIYSAVEQKSEIITTTKKFWESFVENLDRFAEKVKTEDNLSLPSDILSFVDQTYKNHKPDNPNLSFSDKLEFSREIFMDQIKDLNDLLNVDPKGEKV